MRRLEELTWNELADELRQLAEHRPAQDGGREDPRVVLHDLFVHQVELEMQNRELRDAQQQLEASRARYVDLYDFAPVGCLTLGPDERIQEINLSGAALVGRDRAEIVGRPFLGVVPLGDKTNVFHDHIRRCMSTRRRVDDEIEFLPSGRPAMTLHMTSAPMLNAQSGVVGCRMALTDVTDLRRAERAEAEAKMKDDFLGTVSHELRTPLTAILGWTRVLQKRELAGEESDRELLRHALDVIMRNATFQGRLIEDILDVSRILAGKMRLELSPLDLEPLVRACVDGLRPSAQAKGIALSATVAPGSFVLGDRARLMQVLTNLSSNALKFSPPGARIDVEVTAGQDRVRLVVRDTGRGIAEQDLPHIFERFKQVDSSTTRTAGGLGLGLAIVDHIVRAHGGDVAATSPGLGLGATFTVRLRKADRAEDSELEAAPLAPERDGLEGCTILCVDDDLDALEMMALVLREQGAVVTTARSAAEAMALLTASPPDAVVSDIGLPLQDGFALLRQIRALPGETAHVPAIAITAYAGTATEQHAREAGFQRFVCKPVQPDTLVRVVASILRGDDGRTVL